MYLGVKCIRDLAGRPGEDDKPSSRRNLVDRKSMRREPGTHRRQLCVAGSKPRAKLGGRKPHVILRRVRILLCFDQGIERRLLLR